MTKLTVLMPVRNGLPYLMSAIKSIQHQTFSEYKFMVLDGGSTDGSLDLLHSVALEDDRIQVVDGRDSLPTVRINHALSSIASKYVAFMHADDLSRPERLKEQLIFLDSAPAVGLCGSAVDFLNSEDTLDSWKGAKRHRVYPVTHDDIWSRLPFWWCFCLSSLMFRTELISKYGLRFDESLIYTADYWFYFQAAEKMRVANIAERLHGYRIHGTAESATKQKEIWAEDVIVRQRIAAALAIPATKREMELHMRIRLETDLLAPVRNSSDIREVGQWFLKLREWNHKQKRISIRVFDDLLATYWRWLFCYAKRNHIPGALPTFVASPLFLPACIIVLRRVIRRLYTLCFSYVNRSRNHMHLLHMFTLIFR